MAVIFLSIIIGFLLRRVRVFDLSSAMVLSHVVVYLALPCFIFLKMKNFTPDRSLAALWQSGWLVLITAIVFFVGLGKMLGWSRQTIGGLILATGLGNTSFIGFPTIEALFGTNGIQFAIIFDQLGTFLAFSTLGLGCAWYFSGEKIALHTTALRLLRFPPLIAFLLGLLLQTTALPGPLEEALHKFSLLLTPLALLSIGCQLEFPLKIERPDWNALVAGLSYKLVFAPLLVFSFLKMNTPLSEVALQVGVLEAAMPPMITGSLLAVHHKLNPPLVAVLVTVGTATSAITLWGWSHLLANSL